MDNGLRLSIIQLAVQVASMNKDVDWLEVYKRMLALFKDKQ